MILSFLLRRKEINEGHKFFTLIIHSMHKKALCSCGSHHKAEPFRLQYNKHLFPKLQNSLVLHIFLNK